MPAGRESVGDLWAYLGLDDKDFVFGMRRAVAEMQSTSVALGSLAQNMGMAFTSTAVIGGLGFLAAKIYKLGVAQEQVNTSFEVFLKSGEKAKKLIAEITEFARLTPFTSTDVSEAAKRLLAFGFAGDEIMPTIKMLGEISAGTGKNLAELAVIFGQIKTAGRLMGQDLLQLINAGFNPLQIISQKTGKSMLVLRKEMEAGLISFDMVEQAFRDATSEGGLFFKMMEKQSKTVGGLMSTLQDNIENIGKGLFAANTGPMKDFIKNLVDITENTEQIVYWVGVWLKLATLIPVTTAKIVTGAKDTNTAIKEGSISLMGFKGIQVDINEEIKRAGDGYKQINDTLEETKQKFFAITIPTIEKLDTIAKLETKITELKEQAKNATAGELPLLGQSIRYYERQKELLEGIRDAEGQKALKPFVDTSMAPLSDSNPFGTMIHGATQSANAYAALILQIRNVKTAQQEWANHAIASNDVVQSKLEKTIDMAAYFGAVMQDTISDAIAGQKSFAQVMASTALTIVDAIYAIITAKLFEKAVGGSITIWDAVGGIAAASVAAGVVKGFLGKSLQGLDTGGYVTQGGMFQLHKDEVVSLPAGSAVTPAHMTGSMGGGGGELYTEINLRRLIIAIDRERERMGR